MLGVNLNNYQIYFPKQKGKLLSPIFIGVLVLYLLGCSTRTADISTPTIDALSPGNDIEQSYDRSSTFDSEISRADLLSVFIKASDNDQDNSVAQPEPNDTTWLGGSPEGLIGGCLDFETLMETLRSAQNDKEAAKLARLVCHEDSFQGIPDPSIIPKSIICKYTALKNVNCRESDYIDATIIAILLQGDTAKIIAINPALTHGKFELNTLQECWIYLPLMDGPEDPIIDCKVTELLAPLPQVINPSKDDQPKTKTCSKDLGPSDCAAAGGTLAGGTTSAPYCDCP